MWYLAAVKDVNYTGVMHVGKLGIDGDERDHKFHGEPDKAIHGCKSGTTARYFAFCRLVALALDPSTPPPFVSHGWLDLGVEGNANVVVIKMWS